MKNKIIYFFLGTEAELIKMFPVILQLKKNKVNCKIIATGQNDISKSQFLKIVNNGRIDYNISALTKIKKNPFGLLKWYLKTEKKGRTVLVNILKEKNCLVVIHGDTLSTVMGARLACFFKVPYAHVEAGYRSWNYFCPFPEEIDRTYSSYHANFIFCAGKKLINNIKSFKGEKINTYYNTIIDSIKYTLKNIPTKKLKRENYFLFSIHRQENLLNKVFLKNTINEINKLSKKMPCIMFMHPQTEVALNKFSLLKEITKNENVTILPRMPYHVFLSALKSSKFVITDGAGNQQELFYLGVPTLLLRYKTEGSEGLNKNIILFNGKFEKISWFGKNYKKFKRAKIDTNISPSSIIAEKLQKILYLI